jgi:hypothetical protein
MFDNFHKQLQIIERDSVCQCGACKSATNLTLKFIAHYGYIKEIKVAAFVKATGIDMIVAHRLLKNDVDSHEYILMTEPCCSAFGLNGDNVILSWSKSSYAYPSIGTYQLRICNVVWIQERNTPAPPRASFVINKGEDDLRS